MTTPERFHSTVKIAGWTIQSGEDMDRLICETLADMAKIRGTTMSLVDFKVYTIETQALPPRHEAFLTVIAEEVTS